MASEINLQLVNDTISNNLQLHVSSENTHSEHSAIISQMKRRTRAKHTKKTAVAGWISKKFDKQMFEELLLQETMPMRNAKKGIACC